MQLLPRPKDAATTCAGPEEKDIPPPDPRNDLQDGIGTLGGWKLYTAKSNSVPLRKNSKSWPHRNI
jgi:hypothetical protein